MISNAIRYNEYNITKVAKALGVSRNTIYLKIKKYRLEMEKSYAK